MEQEEQNRHHHEVMSELERLDVEFYGAPGYIHLALTDDERHELLARLFETLYSRTLADPEADTIELIREFADSAFNNFLAGGYSHD